MPQEPKPRHLKDIYSLAERGAVPNWLYLKEWSDRPGELVVLIDNGECAAPVTLDVQQVRFLRNQLTNWLGEEPDGPR